MENFMYLFENDERGEHQYQQQQQLQHHLHLQIQQQQQQQQQVQQQQIQQMHQAQQQQHLFQHQTFPYPNQQHQQNQPQQQNQYLQRKLPAVPKIATAGAAGAAAATTASIRQQKQKQQRKPTAKPPARSKQLRQSFSSKRGGGLAVGSRRYFAIRTCHLLREPAIFCCWEDCSIYIDSDDTEEVKIDPEFQVFDNLQKAVEYIEIYAIEEEEEEEEEQQNGKQTQQNNINIQKTPTTAMYNTNAASTTATATAHSTSVINRKKRSAQAAFQGDSNNNNNLSRNQNRKKLPFASKGTRNTEAESTSASSDDDDDNNGNEFVYVDNNDNDPDDDNDNNPHHRPPSPGATFAASISGDNVGNESSKKRGRRTVIQQQQQQQRTHAATRRGNHNHHYYNNHNDETENEHFNQMVQVYLDTVAAKKAIKTNPKLQAWIKKQREEYDAFKSNSPNTTMTPDRFTRLTEIKFPFQKKQTLSWEERANEWYEFYTEHGRDPISYTKDRSKDTKKGLIKWIYLQRSKYERRQAGAKTNLTDEQIEKLTNWGFTWTFTKRMPQNLKLKSWDARYQDLVEFKQLHGHTSPPPLLPGLGSWCRKQKLDYQKFVKGDATPLTKEKVAKLFEIGFDFTSYQEQRLERNAEKRKAREELKKQSKETRQRKKS